MLIVERFYTGAGFICETGLFLFCVNKPNCLIINNTCFVWEIFAKNIVKNLSKVLQVLKNVLPLHSLNETHGDLAVM